LPRDRWAGYDPGMEILIPLIIGLSLIWLIGRGVPWNAKLMTIVVALAVVILIVALDRGGYWPEAWRR
jgi:hypothetical protein